MNVLNKDRYDTLDKAREAYRKWQEGCMRLRWSCVPFDEWLYSPDGSEEMSRALANAEEGRGTWNARAWASARWSSS